MPRTDSSRKTTGIGSIITTSDTWPSVILPGRVHHADVVQIRVRERVVERQRDAGQDRGDHEDEVGRGPSSSPARRGRATLPDGDLLPARRRRRVRQRRRGCRPPSPRMRAAASRNGVAPASIAHEADDQVDDDPAERPHDADRREVAPGVGDLLHRDRVGERDRREVAQAERQHQAVDRAEALDLRDQDTAAPRRARRAPP